MTQADLRPAAPAALPSLALPLAAAVVSGAMVALQQRINGELGMSLHDPLLAAVVSFGSGLVVLVLLVLRPATRGRVKQVRAVPWWSRLGGLGGASLVAVGATAAPRIGVAVLTVGLVAGSTVAGLLVDRWGLAPGGHRPITGPRLAGAALCLAAIVVSAVGRSRSTSVGLLALVVLAGALISFQQAFNGHVRQAADATVATFVNFVVGTTALVLGYALRVAVVGVAPGAWPGPDRAYLYLGGVMGATFVAVASVVVRQLGVLRLGLAVTAGQLLGSIAVDLDRGVALSTVAAAVLTMVAVAISGLRRRS